MALPSTGRVPLKLVTVDKGGDGGLLLLGPKSAAAISPVLQVTGEPWVIRAYGLGSGNTIAVYNYDVVSGMMAPLTASDALVRLSETATSVVLSLAGAYRLVSTAPLGTVVAMAKRLPQEGEVLDGLRSQNRQPNPYLRPDDGRIVSSNIQVVSLQWVFRAYALTGSDKFVVQNVGQAEDTTAIADSFLGGVAIELTPANTTVILAASGTYRFRREGTSGLLMGNESAIEYVGPYMLGVDVYGDQQTALDLSGGVIGDVLTNIGSTGAWRTPSIPLASTNW